MIPVITEHLESAYVQSLDLLLDAVKNNYFDYFNEETQIILNQLRNLSYPVKSLISRMILRKYEWLKQSSCTKYVPMSSNLFEVIQSSTDIIQILHESSEFDSIFNAIESCFTTIDIKVLCSFVDALKYTTREETLIKLKRQMMTQKSVTGEYTSARLGKFAMKILDRNHDSLMRIQPLVLLTIRRFQRVVGITSDMDVMRAGVGSSIHTTPDTSLALLVTFKKLRFPTYTILQTLSLFQSRLEFERFEAACELQQLLITTTSSIGLDDIQNITDSARLENQLLSYLTCFGIDEVNSRFYLLWRLIVKVKFGVLRISLLLMIALSTTAEAVPYGIQRPDYLMFVDAGYLLASCLHKHCAVLEKAPFKDYQLCVLLLQLLLACPFSPHRRGKWYRRICINLETHLKLPAVAARIAELATKDPAVKLGDAIDLKSRLQRLQRRCASACTTSSRYSLELDGVLVELFHFVQDKTSEPDNFPDPICSACTFLNTRYATICEICGNILCLRRTSAAEVVDLISDDDKDVEEVAESEVVVDDFIEDFVMEDLEMVEVLEEGQEVSGRPLSIDDSRLRTKSSLTSIAIHVDDGDENNFLEHDRALLGLKLGNAEVLELSGRRFGDTSRRGKNKFVGKSEGSQELSLLSVEDYVLETLNEPSTDDETVRVFIKGGGWSGFHDEGCLLRSLVCLLMWDVFFTSLPDVFLSPFQDAPLDLLSSTFYLTRKTIIEATLERIAQASPQQIINKIGTVYRANYKCRCKRMVWDIPLPILQLVAACMGGRGLAGVCRGMCANFKYFSSGAPDLTVFRVKSMNEVITPSILFGSDVWMKARAVRDRKDEKDINLHAPVKKPRRQQKEINHDDENQPSISGEVEEGEVGVELRPDPFLCPYKTDVEALDEWSLECMLVEVKGPTDRLSPQQSVWLDLLSAHGVKAFVCRIKEDRL